tara:strand:- start:23 stop:319 length:297 start_codon:yes stop_codon:yes gene_type:complete
MTHDLIAQIAQLRRLAAASETSADNLLHKYGHGVRPSWVSAEVASHGSRADLYLRAAAGMNMEVAVASAAVIGPIAAAACHDVCLSSLYETINTTKEN